MGNHWCCSDGLYRLVNEVIGLLVNRLILLLNLFASETIILWVITSLLSPSNDPSSSWAVRIRRKGQKGDRIQQWKLELLRFHFDNFYRPGWEDSAADALIRNFCCDLKKLHKSLCYSRITRLVHFLYSRNLPFSVEDVKAAANRYHHCATIKLRLYCLPYKSFNKSTEPFEGLSVYFKGLLPSVTRSCYLLTIIDEHSQIPLAFEFSNATANTINFCFLSWLHFWIAFTHLLWS